MLMICRVVAYCFRRIAMCDVDKELWLAKKENRKTKLQGFRPPGRKILKSQIQPNLKIRPIFSRLVVVLGRLFNYTRPDRGP